MEPVGLSASELPKRQSGACFVPLSLLTKDKLRKKARQLGVSIYCGERGKTRRKKYRKKSEILEDCERTLAKYGVLCAPGSTQLAVDAGIGIDNCLGMAMTRLMNLKKDELRKEARLLGVEVARQKIWRQKVHILNDCLDVLQGYRPYAGLTSTLRTAGTGGGIMEGANGLTTSFTARQ